MVVLFHLGRQEILGSLQIVLLFFINHMTNLNRTGHLGYSKTLSKTRPQRTGRYDMGSIESFLEPSGMANGIPAR